jgi:phosphohistidine phosphatase
LGAYIFGGQWPHKRNPNGPHAIVSVEINGVFGFAWRFNHGQISAREHAFIPLSGHRRNWLRQRFRALDRRGGARLAATFRARGFRPVSRLFLLRHAKAGWAQPGMKDIDRPLDATGRADAEAIGEAMKRRGHASLTTLCSPARRARETLEGVRRHAGVGKVEWCEELYSGGASSYLALIAAHGDVEPMLVVGHNPMMEDLAFALSGDGDERARAAVAGGFPAAGLATIRFAESLAEVERGKGYLETFLTPANL